jgi:hypothetical protein
MFLGRKIEAENSETEKEKEEEEKRYSLEKRDICSS